MRWALCLEYIGTRFIGWQKQHYGISVQQEVDEALSMVGNEPIETVGSGRTDTGVHASGQVVHFDTEGDKRTPIHWVRGGNACLPKDISIRWCQQVTQDFHARHKAVSRHYRYIFLNTATPFAAIRPFCLHIVKPLDVAAMQEGASCLCGEHDFSSFRGAGCQSKSTVRRITKITVTRQEEAIYLDVWGNAFLQRMVRNIAGLLVEIGLNKRQPQWASWVLAQKERTRSAATAKSKGLHFVGAKYPLVYTLPKPQRAPILIL